MNARELSDALKRMARSVQVKRTETAHKVEHGHYGLETHMDSLMDAERLLATVVIENIGTLELALDPDTTIKLQEK